jgi:chemotaxis protein MotB
MRGARGRRSGQGEANYWPGYVDVLSTLLLVVTFLLSMFMLAQFFVSQEASGKDSLLRRLNRQIAQLTELLSLEKGQKKSIQDELSALTASLTMTKDENKRLSGLVGLGDDKAKSASAQLGAVSKELDDQKRITSDALAQVEVLNLQILALRRQMAAIEEALQASERKDREAQDRIKDLGQRLNVALAKKVQELQRYRSDFFGRLRDLLANKPGIRVVGDRFVFDAEVLFPSGSADIAVDGLATLDQLAAAMRELEGQIPADIPWVLRVDGHTDVRPIRSPQFPSNWELSSARATSVVKFLIARGVQPTNLAAAGFGEFQPIDPGNTEEARRRNRRIELKLDTR